MNDKKCNFNNRYRFFILFLVFLIEYLLFRSYAYREVIGKVPRNMDQIMYMQCAYELYDAVIHRNWNLFFDLITKRIHTSGIPLIGVLNLFLFGNSYYSFLLMNFFAFITAQITGSYAVYKCTNKWTYVWIWTGLLATLKSPFYWAGDLLDFRADFIALCLYTCWIAIYFVYLKSSENRYFKISAIFAGILVFCRMLTALYVGGILVIFEFINVFIRQKSNIGNVIKKYIIYLLIMLISGAWFLLACVPQFLSYYMTHIDKSDESTIRRMEQGIYTLWDNISFYPVSLIKDHLGSKLCIFIVFCFIMAVIYHLTGKIKLFAKKISGQQIFILISILLPFIILTMDEAKSPVAINIISGSVVLAAVMFLYSVFDQHFKLKTFFVIISCCIGITGYLRNSTSYRTGYSSEEQCSLIHINDTIADYIIHNDKQETMMFVDRTLDGINAMTTRYWMSMRDEMGHDVYDYTYDYDALHDGIVKTTSVTKKPSEEEIENLIETADIIVVSDTGYGSSFYLSDNEIDKYREKIWNYAIENLNFLTREYVYGTWVSVFCR